MRLHTVLVMITFNVQLCTPISQNSGHPSTLRLALRHSENIVHISRQNTKVWPFNGIEMV